MSFIRDPDRRTRGAGAIAALDGLPSRRWRFARMVKATQSRDRKMAAITGGALAMGADRVPIRNEGRDTTVNVVTSPPPPPAAVSKPPVYAPPGAITPPPVPTVPPPVAVIPPTPTPIPGPITTVIGGGGRATGGGTTTSTTVVGAGSPVPVTKPPVSLPPLPGLPDMPDVAAEDNTQKYLLMAGGAALLAYLLFRRRSP